VAIVVHLKFRDMFAYDTLSQAVDELKKRGFTTDFNLESDHLSCSHSPVRLSPSEFEITEVYRFEGESDPADESVVYAIESRHGQKGVLVDGFGISANNASEEMIEKLRHKR
jgi:hypothetical protein